MDTNYYSLTRKSIIRWLFYIWVRVMVGEITGDVTRVTKVNWIIQVGK